MFQTLLLISLATPGLAAPEKELEKPATIAVKTAAFKKLPGCFPLYWDERSGKLWLEIGAFGAEFLYVESLASGVGSNDLGLDRGQLGDERVVRFERVGPKVLLVQPNYAFRATRGTPEERRAVEDSFARSTLWGFEVAAEEEGRVLVDATAFFLRDAHNVIGAMKQEKEGDYQLDATRSALYLPGTRNFPKNTEIEAALTFTGRNAGHLAKEASPDADAITVRVHHSLVQLPEPGFETLASDPRAGYFAEGYEDFSAGLGERLTKRWSRRFRLRKKNPAEAVGEPISPIVYYLDRGAPEPFRSALLEGAGWWNQAFEAAGYKNAFRVELLPEDADPLDIRYNVIHWVHRTPERGWSYGYSIDDPRTGELIKGNVVLSSTRVRVDHLIAEGLLAPYGTGKLAPQEAEAMALARLRQLAAHEVGHSLGLAHNFAASASDRASVMDYPYPLAVLKEDGAIDLSRAYAVGIGEWDKVAISFGYRDFPPGTDAPAERLRLLSDARAKGLLFLSDQDVQRGSAHPKASLWDNGPDAVDELGRVLKVRAAALARFSENAVQPGRPLATLEEALVPLYLSHRHQTTAAARSIGGADYDYALRGDGRTAVRPVPEAQQRRALDAVLATLRPDALRLPDRIVRIIPPRPMGYGRGPELFANATGGTFDPLSAAQSAAGHTVSLLLESSRAARLVESHARDGRDLGFGEVLDRLLAASWRAPAKTGYEAALLREVQDAVLSGLLRLAADESAPVRVRSIAGLKLHELSRELQRSMAAPKDDEQRAQTSFAIALIRRFQEDPAKVHIPESPRLPPGEPMGCGADQ